MATWDHKEREQFRIDSLTLKDDIDKIQSEKISALKRDFAINNDSSAEKIKNFELKLKIVCYVQTILIFAFYLIVVLK